MSSSKPGQSMHVMLASFAMLELGSRQISQCRSAQACNKAYQIAVSVRTSMMALT